MKTLADLKRKMIVGCDIEMLTFNGHTPPERLKTTRTIRKVQTNGVYLGMSWFEFPKASELSIHTDNHFTVRDRTKNGDVCCTREYLIKN